MPIKLQAKDRKGTSTKENTKQNNKISKESQIIIIENL